MTRLILTLSTFLAILFFSVPLALAQPAPEQRFALIQADYDEYAQLFQMNKEPNLSPIGDEGMKAPHRNNRWEDYAKGDEERKPMLAAQVLMGIYMVQHADHRVANQIETIIVEPFLLSSSLAERITFDNISWYLKKTPTLVEAIRQAGGVRDVTFDSDEEIQRIGETFVKISGDWKHSASDILSRLTNDVRKIGLTRIVSGSPRRRAEVQAVRNLFVHDESHRNWAATYRHMREKFDVLDSLADSFTFEDNRLKAFQLVVGTYESTKFHRGTLIQIHRYFRAAAEQGDPIAQYHLALFLKYLGDLIDIDKEEIAHYEKWLDQAGGTVVAKDRVAEAKTQLAEEAKEGRIASRAAMKAERIKVLLKLENEKMDMIEVVIVEAAKRLASAE